MDEADDPLRADTVAVASGHRRTLPRVRAAPDLVMLMLVHTPGLPPHRALPPSRTLLAALLCSVLIATGCRREAAPDSRNQMRAATEQQRQLNDEVRRQLDTIPPPSKTRYMAVKSLSAWENPYITVQGAMLTLHVLLADANTSGLGQGGMLRPVGARRQELNIRVDELPAALNAIPAASWTYGRVMAIEEAHDTPASARPEVRRNMEAVMRTLSDLGVVVYEWTEGGPGLR